MTSAVAGGRKAAPSLPANARPEQIVKEIKRLED